MPLILTTCPTTGAQVSTGQHSSRPGAAIPAPQSGSFRCSSCGRVHDWSMDTAWIKVVPGATAGKYRRIEN